MIPARLDRSAAGPACRRRRPRRRDGRHRRRRGTAAGAGAERAGDGGQPLLRHRDRRRHPGSRPAYMRRVRAECGMVTGETAFKWGQLRPKARPVGLEGRRRADGVRRATRHPGPRPHHAVARAQPSLARGSRSRPAMPNAADQSHPGGRRPLPRPGGAVGRGERGARPAAGQAVRAARHASGPAPWGRGCWTSRSTPAPRPTRCRCAASTISASTTLGPSMRRSVGTC